MDKYTDDIYEQFMQQLICSNSHLTKVRIHICVVISVFYFSLGHGLLHSVHWHCWFGIRKSIWPVKNWVIRCRHGYLSGAKCKWFVYGPADATVTSSSLASVKSRTVWPFWCRLIKVVLEKRRSDGCLVWYGLLGNRQGILPVKNLPQLCERLSCVEPDQAWTKSRWRRNESTSFVSYCSMTPSLFLLPLEEYDCIALTLLVWC